MNERDPAIDALRGLALSGVVLVNLLTEFRVPFLAYLERFHTDLDAPSHAVDWLVGMAIEQKAFAVMALLFGVGIGALSERLGARAHRVLGRRFAFLLVIGVVHAVFVFSGDILTLYAVTGFAVLGLVGASTRTLAIVAGCAMLLRVVVPWPSVPIGLSSDAMIAHERAAYAQGSFAVVAHFRVDEIARFIGPLCLFVLPRTIALTLLGTILWRKRALKRWSVGVAVGSLAVGCIGTGVEAYAASTGFDLGRARTAVSDAGVIGLALFYGPLVLRRSPVSMLVRLFAPLGRLSLSAYLMQTITLGAIFYGYGFGLFARLTSFEGMLVALVFYAVQLGLAHAYLSRFRLGPMEWIWRRVTQSMS